MGVCNVPGDQELKTLWKLTCSKGIKEASMALVPNLIWKCTVSVLKELLGNKLLAC